MTIKYIKCFNSHVSQKPTNLFTPAKPVRYVDFYIQFNQSGTAYFDNVFLEEEIPGNKSIFVRKFQGSSNQVTCYDPLVYKPPADGATQGTCEIPCPVAFYNVKVEVFKWLTKKDKRTFDALQVVELLCAYLSLVGSIFVIVSWLVLKPHRKYPGEILSEISPKIARSTLPLLCNCHSHRGNQSVCR